MAGCRKGGEIRNSKGGKEEGLRAALSRTFCDNGIVCILCRAPKIVALGHVVECGYCSRGPVV